jgi:hypothetical protein
MKLTIGRIVHFVLPGTILPGNKQHRAGAHRPAIIVAINCEGTQHETLQIQVFTDGSNDGIGKDANRNLYWATSVRHDEDGKAPGTWHWPEREGVPVLPAEVRVTVTD